MINRTFARFSFCIATLLGAPGLAGSAAQAAPSPCPWLFFDLGADSLVTTIDTPAKPFGSPSSVFFAKGDAKNGDGFEYLRALHAQGYTLGLIVNFPDEYPAPGEKDDFNPKLAYDPARAADPAYRREVKRDYVKKLVENAWDHSSAHPMKDPQDWKEFWALFEGRFLVPSTNAERKDKDKNSQLFKEAVELARRGGCRNVIYQSAMWKELTLLQQLARTAGGAIAPYFEGKWGLPDYYLSSSELAGYNAGDVWRKAQIDPPAPAGLAPVQPTPEADIQAAPEKKPSRLRALGRRLKFWRWGRH